MVFVLAGSPAYIQVANACDFIGQSGESLSLSQLISSNATPKRKSPNQVAGPTNKKPLREGFI